MFSIFKKKFQQPGNLEDIGCDIHSHLIPGIDDGAPDMDTSLRLIGGLADLGYRKLITTPHVNSDYFRNTNDIIRNGRALVAQELHRRGPSIEFEAAAEYLLDDGFTQTLGSGGAFLTLKDNLVLVELSFVVPAINLRKLLFDLQVKNYQPVLAHPERYLYFAASKGWYDELRTNGCLFQLNLLSFTGHYGREVRELAQYLVKKRYVDFLGTDMHHERHLEILRSSPAVFRIARDLTQAGLLRNPSL